MKIATRMILGLTATLAFSAPARAQDAGFYAGASLGQAKYRSCPGATVFSDPLRPPPSGCDGSDTAWRLFGGYRFNRHFSAELGFADLGQATGNLPPSNTNTTSTTGTLDTETTAWDLTAIGALPLVERLSLIGKVGLYHAGIKNRSTRTTFFAGFISSSVVTDSSDNDSGVTFGVGAQYDFARHFGVRVEWQRYGKVGSAATGEIDIDVLSAGLLYRF